MNQTQEIVDKPWGRERILEVNSGYCVKILEVDPGQRLSLQYHVYKRETMYCLYGTGTLELHDPTTGMKGRMTLLPGRYYTIEPGMIHRLYTAPTSPVAVLEASTPELDDVERLEDDYGRQD